MAKIIDRFLLFLFSLAVLVALCLLLLAAFGVFSFDQSRDFIHKIYFDMNTAVIFITAAIVMLLIALRMIVLSLGSGKGEVPTIDQRTEYGDVRISLDTVENLALKAANRSRGLKDLKARVKVTAAGLELLIRAVVDGETAIPALTEEIQSAVKIHIEEITGIPVAGVSVYVANVAHSANTFKSRVE